MVGKLPSFWEGLFSGAMFILGMIVILVSLMWILVAILINDPVGSHRVNESLPT